MKKVSQIGLLCHLYNCEPEEITRHAPGIYEWRGIMYEVRGRTKTTAPNDHYIFVQWAGKMWALRELGSQSKIIKSMKG